MKWAVSECRRFAVCFQCILTLSISFRRNFSCSNAPLGSTPVNTYVNWYFFFLNKSKDGKESQQPTWNTCAAPPLICRFQLLWVCYYMSESLKIYFLPLLAFPQAYLVPHSFSVIYHGIALVLLWFVCMISCNVACARLLTFTVWLC